MRVAILAHGKFPDHAKTATGVMRYGNQDVVAVLDRERAGTSVREYADWLPDAPIVAGMEDVEDVDALLIGIAPIGGGFDESWREDVHNALSRGCDVIAGLHDRLSSHEEFAALAAETGATIEDVRVPSDDIGVAEGRADEVDATVIKTVGTDCSTGKFTTTFELVQELRDAGFDAAAIPTGQTGIMVEGWGEPVDAVVADYVAGAVERMILERGNEHEILVVEGQGSLVHPAYSGVTCGMLHGAMPDGLILCHDPRRQCVNGFERFPIPPLEKYARLYESVAAPVAASEIIGVATNTSQMNETAARLHLEDIESELGVPAADVIRFGTDPLVDAIQ